MRKISSAALAGALIVPATGSAVGAAPADSVPSDGVIATYNGRQINLEDGWQGAQACLAFTLTDLRCYDSRSDIPDALVAAARRPAAAAPVAAPLASCSSAGQSVTLYSDINMGGQSLSFQTTSGAWTNLAPYGFDNTMESWTNTTGCTARVADGNGGSGDQLTLAARSSSSNVGSTWKNRASSINVP